MTTLPHQISVLVVMASSAETNVSVTHIIDEMYESKSVARAGLGHHLQHLMEFHQLPAAKPDDLVSAFADYKPHVVHFFCPPGPNGGIGLLNRVGQIVSVQVSAIKLNFTLTSAKDVRVVLFTSPGSDAFAETIISNSRTLQYIIGAKEGVTTEQSIAFGSGFYAAISRGMTITDAFHSGNANAANRSESSSSDNNTAPFILAVSKSVILDNKPLLNSNVLKPAGPIASNSNNTLQILVLLASSDKRTLNVVDTSTGVMQDTAKELGYSLRDKIKFEFKHEVCTSDLAYFFDEFQPRIVHIHCNVEEDSILLRDEQKKCVPLTATDVIRYLNERHVQARDIELLLLMGCNSERMARQIIDGTKVKFIVASNRKVTELEMKYYANQFFGSIGRGNGVRYAHKEADSHTGNMVDSYCEQKAFILLEKSQHASDQLWGL